MNSKIVIIGAGASGTAAFTKLLELGFKNVIILEAEDRIGGRINTIPFASNVVDLGAQWCHGEKDNVVYEFAKKFNLFDSSFPSYEKFLCIKSNKEIIPNDITLRLTGMVHQFLDDAKTDLKGTQDSLGSYITKRYFDMLKKPENSDINGNVAKQYLDFYFKFENSIEASDTVFDVSGDGYSHYWDCDGDPLLNWKDKGYVTFINLLMYKQPIKKENFSLDNRIKLRKCVYEIQWGRYRTNKVLIKCDDGEEIEADHVICTMSLGVLKEKHSQLFTPSLPQEKVNAIKGLSFGTVDKIFIGFEKPFWTEDFKSFGLLWENDDLVEIQNSPNSWLADVFGFYTVDYNPNILCGWISGPNARKMEMLSDKIVLDGVLFLLRKFLQWPIPKPINFKRSSWYTNPNFRGSYSYRSMLTNQFQTKAADLAQPIERNNSLVLQFAGEATNDHYYSTVHGAVESGWREAKRLFDFYTKTGKRSQL